MNRLIVVASLLAVIPSLSWSATGIATLKGTAPNSPIQGTIRFTDTPKGLEVKAQVINVTPGKHGFHIHEFGACEDMAKAAGDHYNPMSQTHGNVIKSGVQHVHGGDLGNVTVLKDGSGTVEVVIPGLTLSAGPQTVAGRSVVLHEKEDDLTSQPAGNAGTRVACGPILLVSDH